MVQHDAADFAAVLGSPEKPLIVSGQAVNIWAALYLPERPELADFEPFTSKDADIYGTRALAEAIAQRAGWEFVPSTARDSIMVGELKKAVSGEPPLKIEVLREVNGLTDEDLKLAETVELAPGQVYRILTPPALLKGKLYNLVSLVGLDRPQDLKHTRMLLHIVPQYLNEITAATRDGRVSESTLVGAIDYLREITHSEPARSAARMHSLDYHELIPSALLMGPGAVREAVRLFYEGLPPKPAIDTTAAIEPPFPLPSEAPDKGKGVSR